MTDMETYYTPKEVAEMLKVTRTAIYQQIYRGNLNAVYVGSQRRISKTELDKFLSERK